LTENFDGSYGYLKVVMSDRLAIEKLVGYQLAVLTSLDIRQNSYSNIDSADWFLSDLFQSHGDVAN